MEVSAIALHISSGNRVRAKHTEGTGGAGSKRHISVPLRSQILLELNGRDKKSEQINLRSQRTEGGHMPPCARLCMRKSEGIGALWKAYGSDLANLSIDV